VQRLCRRAQEGDKVASSALLKLFYKTIFNYLRRLCGNTQNAEDLTQEAFIRLWSSLNSYQHQCKFSTWVHRIAYNSYIDWRRKEDKIVPQSDAWWEGQSGCNPDPFKCAEDKQLAEQLYRLVDQLNELEKQVIYLHFYQGLSLRDVAFVLEEAPSTIRYKFHKAIKYLKSKINEAITQ
jgi:RNA polymerase sigma-70 factor (ECF subfamily)